MNSWNAGLVCLGNPGFHGIRCDSVELYKEKKNKKKNTSLVNLMETNHQFGSNFKDRVGCVFPSPFSSVKLKLLD